MNRSRLVIRSYILTVLPRERSAREDRVGEANEEDPDGRREEVPDIASMDGWQVDPGRFGL